jgi:hypothetical protein
MTTSTKLALAALTAAITFTSSTASADKIVCDAAAKKLEWHVCVVAPVEYKRGMKTETRDECKVDRVVKPADGCNFGDLAKHIPAEAAGNLDSVKFYAIAPADFDDSVWEAQKQPPAGFCSLGSGTPVDGWQLMKFGDAFDKDNRERSELVKEKLKKANKRIGQFGITLSPDPQGCKKPGPAKLGVLDRKSLAKFLVYAELTYPTN